MAKESKKNQQIVYKVAEDRDKALNETLAKIEKDYGKGAIMRLGDNANMQVEFIPTGSIGLDIALGIGGIPKGRIVEIFGPESSGKTTVALHIAAQVQKRGGIAAFIDAEHALDPVYARALGVDIDSLLVSQPDSGEQGLEITEALVRSAAVDLIVVDSVAALVPRTEIEGEMGDANVGLHARLMSQALRKLAGAIGKTNCTVIFINQLREKIGGMSYGPSETTTGGRALRFYASVRLDVRRISYVKDADTNVGNHVLVKVVKNKVAPPFKTCQFDIMYGKGISRLGELVDMGESLGFVKKSGSWFSLGDERMGQGRDKAILFLADNPDKADELEEKIRTSYKPSDMTTDDDGGDLFDDEE